MNSTQITQDERGRLATQIQAASNDIAAETAGLFEEAQRNITTKKAKLQALQARRGDIPKELAALDALEAKTRKRFADVITDEGQASKIAQELLAIHGKRHTLELMQGELGRLAPVAEQEVKAAQMALITLAEKELVRIAEGKVKKALPIIESLNDEMAALDYALQDIAENFEAQGFLAWIDRQNLLDALSPARCRFFNR